MKRDDADFEIHFLFWSFLIVMGVSLLGAFFGDNDWTGYWIISFFIGLIGMVVIKVVRGFHNVLLDIRDSLMDSP